MGLKWTEMLMIFVVILLLFGSTRLPALGSSLGSAIRNFKKGFSGDGEEKDATPVEKSLTPGSPQQQVQAQDKATSKQG